MKSASCSMKLDGQPSFTATTVLHLVQECWRLCVEIMTFLAHDLHFRGLGDSSVLNHEDWRLFGVDPEDALAELKQIALRGEVIVQSAAGLVQISWKHKNMEELAHAFAHS